MGQVVLEKPRLVSVRNVREADALCMSSRGSIPPLFVGKRDVQADINVENSLQKSLDNLDVSAEVNARRIGGEAPPAAADCEDYDIEENRDNFDYGFLPTKFAADLASMYSTYTVTDPIANLV